MEPVFKVSGDAGGPETAVGPLGIIALPGTQEIAQKINRYLVEWRNRPENGDDNLKAHPGYARDTFLIDAALPRFGNGEGKGIIRETVRGYDIYILCDIGNYGETYSMFGMDYPMSPDDHYQNLKRVIAALGGKARRITVVMPMLYEGRQHRRMARESLDCAIALQELVAMGVDNLIAFDAHDPRVQNAIPLHGFENVMPTYQMLKACIRHEPDLVIRPDQMMVVSPDEGGMGRNIYFATFMGLDLGMFYKRRDYTRIINGRNPIIAHEYIGADVAGKDILIADDILSSGDSMLDLATELKKRNARNIYMFITYALFTDGLGAFNKAYREGIITRLYSTNLTYRTPELKAAPWFREVEMSKYISYIIATLNHDRSVSALLDPAVRVASLLKRKRESEI
ncbi:MAG: ribose-phosphate pyrophosphokinase [Christensenellales bacterium]